MTLPKWSWTVVLATLAAAPAPARIPPPWYIQAEALDTGAHANPSDSEIVALERDIVADGAPWMQIRFLDWNLGRRSYITLTSAEDGGWQRLDARSLPDWNGASAIFNGDRVRMELHVAPGDEGVYVRLKDQVVGHWVGGVTPTESQCGNADNRVAASDNRVGRLFFGGCTAWFVNNGAVLTAGHCTDFDPDRSGPMLPDGTVDLSGVVEINVPASRADGTTVAANPNDQFPINTSGIAFNFDGEGQGLGKDWSVFRVNPNSNTGQRAHIVGGFFRMTNANTAVGATIRVTGFGSDTGAANFTEQTHTGPYAAEQVSGANYWHQYAVDTEGGNSGSPIIREGDGWTIGIHTNAGCTSTGGANNGTSFEHGPLELALQNFWGVNTVYVDTVSTYASQQGRIFQPALTVTLGESLTPSGGVLCITAGAYAKAAGNTGIFGTGNKPMTWIAPVGAVTIGN